MLFYEDKGTFSDDVADPDTGPPYVPPRLWNTPMHYEDRSTSVFVTIEVAGEAGIEPEPQLELIARYKPLNSVRLRVVRRVVSIDIPIKTGKDKDNFHAGFWLYDTGCDPVRLSARIIGRGGAAPLKKVIKFDCGE